MGLLLLTTNIAGIVALWRNQRAAAVMLWTPFSLLAIVLGVLFFRHPF